MAFMTGQAVHGRMCRLFGLMASAATPAEPWLVSTDRSLLAQSNVTEATAQTDGWGIAWYPGQSRVPRIEKGPRGAFEPGEVEQFRRAAAGARGPVVIGHLRRASNPMGLPHARLIDLANSQPFTHGSTIFAHNGMIPFPRETRPLLGRFEERIRGVNDSEVLFWLLVRHLETCGDPLLAYRETAADLVSVWEAKGRPARGPFSGLNVLLSRGPNDLWAFCQSLGEHGGSLFDPERPYYQMVYRADARQLVVASEPLDAESQGWEALTNGHYVHAQARHGLVAVTRGSLDLPLPTLIA